MEEENRGQRGIVPRSVVGEDNLVKGHSSVRASAISARRSHQPGVIELEK